MKLSNVDDDPCSDYINASYIPVSEHEAIAWDKALTGGDPADTVPPTCSHCSQVWKHVDFRRLCLIAIKPRVRNSITAGAHFHNGCSDTGL